MRVALHVDQLWFAVPGGIGTYVRELWSRMGEGSGVEVVPFRSRWRSDRIDWTVPPNGTVTTGRHALRYPLWNLVAWPPLPRPLGACDVVHATHHAAVPPIRSGQRLVVTVHDLAFDRFPDSFPERWRLLYRAGLRAAVRRAHAIVVPSRATASDLAERTDVDPARVFVTPLAAATPVTSGDPDAVLDVHGIPRPYVLFVGTIAPRKNVTTLVRAFRRIAGDVPHTLVLAGAPGWGSAMPHLLGDPPHRIEHAGLVAPELLDALYRRAAAFCYPSRYEGFGLPVLEAMQRGVPVVASTTPAIAEVAGDAAILVDPDDEAGLADALVRVLTDPHTEARLRDVGPPRAAAFSWERTAEQTLAVYRRVVGQAS